MKNISSTVRSEGLVVVGIQALSLLAMFLFLSGCSNGRDIAFEGGTAKSSIGGDQKAGGSVDDGGAGDDDSAGDIVDGGGNTGDGGSEEDGAGEIEVKSCPRNLDAKHACVCHVPLENPARAHNIIVGKSAGASHLVSHGDGLVSGDYLGTCVK